MRLATGLIFLALCGLVVADPTSDLSADRPSAKDLLERYQRADQFGERGRDAVLNLALTPGWVEGGKRFWYVQELPEGKRQVLMVDARDGTKKPAFDHERLAAAISKDAGEKVDPSKLRLEGLAFESNSITFRFKGERYRVDLTDYAITKADAAPSPRPARGSGLSADGQTEARIHDGKVEIRPKDGEWVALSTSTGFARFNWSPDSNHILAWRLSPGDRKTVSVLRSNRAGTRAEIETRMYDQPGDKLDEYEAFVLTVKPPSEKKVDLAPIMGGGQPWSSPPDLQWWRDGKAAIFEYPIRGYQEHRVVDIDMETGAVRTLVTEKSPTFIDQGRIMLRPLADGHRFLWRSERDGWGHLYLFDTDNSLVPRQLTRGAWVVRGIEWIDEEAGWVYFMANGVQSHQDPYHLSLCRVDLEGREFQTLTPDDGTHTIQWSPDRSTFIDTWSRVDAAPVHDLRRTNDGARLATLERADITVLLKNGVRLPERFVAKGRDGKTDIHGIVVRPTKFNPNRRYPVIENIYAGPHDSHVPKAFRPFFNMHRLAELGFIVVQIDGMGTNNRGKAFHDVCWKNVADAGFPDRILWLQELAKKYPSADIARMGIYGTSAGGQNSTGALLFHPEFYKVAVSSCGCHDNRIDKQWWNEQWMGYPVGAHYSLQSNIENADRLQGRLLLFVGEEDRNVPPESTYKLVDALIKARKDFDFLPIPGADHTDGGPYGERKRRDYFVKWLIGVEPPNWNSEAK